MPTSAQVLRLIEDGLSYEEAARRLALSPGLAYMIATGLPADGGDTLAPGDTARSRLITGSSQWLANGAKVESPTQKRHVLDWIKNRATSDSQMTSAAAARTAEPGEPRAADENLAIESVLTRDHDRVTALIRQLSAIPGHKKGGSAAQIQRRETIVGVITESLAQHESTEEQYFWPAVREFLDDGAELADAGTSQEQEGKEVLDALAKSHAHSDEFDDVVERLTLLLRKHVSFEDRVLLRLSGAMPDDERVKLGRTFAQAKKAGKARHAAGRRPADREGQADAP